VWTDGQGFFSACDGLCEKFKAIATLNPLGGYFHIVVFKIAARRNGPPVYLYNHMKS
jgi:hypothetical protein